MKDYIVAEELSYFAKENHSTISQEKRTYKD